MPHPRHVQGARAGLARLGLALTALAVAAALAAHGWVVGTRAWQVVRDEAPLIDYATFDAAVAATRAGADPYDEAALLRHRRAPEPRVLSTFQYPPTFLVALGWTTAHTPAAAARVWFWCNEVALLVAVAALVALAPRPATWLAAAVLLAALGAIPDHLRFGQANALALAPLALGFLALSRWRERLAGVCFAVAVAVKFLPIVVLLPVLAARRTTAVVWCVGASVALALLAIAAAPAAGLDAGVVARATARFWTEVVPALARGELRPPFHLDVFPNLSLASLVARHFGAAGELTPALRPAALAVAAALGCAALAVARRVSPEERPLELAAVAVWPMFLAPGYVFEHHLVLVLPALLLLTARLLGSLDGDRPGLVYAVTATSALGVLAWSIGDLRARANPPGSVAEAALWDAKTWAWLVCFGLTLGVVSRVAQGTVSLGRGDRADPRHVE